MLPLSPRELRRTLKKLGINVEDLKDVVSVVIETKDNEIIIEDPQVAVFTAQGQKIYQIVGKSEKIVEKVSRPSISEVSFSEDDINFIMQQGNVSREVAIEVLKEAEGDLAKALLLIEERGLRKH